MHKPGGNKQNGISKKQDESVRTRERGGERRCKRENVMLPPTDITNTLHTSHKWIKKAVSKERRIAMFCEVLFQCFIC